jgi:hypothetical protein
MNQVQATPVQVEFGHPNFCKTVQDAYPRFFEVYPRLRISFDSISRKSRTLTDKGQKVTLNLCLIAGVAMDELVTLAGNGLGMGAMKIARNLLEVSINAEYLRMNPALVDDYLDWFWVEQHKWLTYAQQHDTDLLSQFLPESVKHVEQEFARVRSRFEKVNNPAELRGSWSATDLGTRAIQTHFEVGYRLINPLGSQFLHGSPGALLNHFDVAGSSDQIVHPPSIKWTAQALCGGHYCLAMVVHTLEALFNEEASPSSENVAQDFQHAWPAPISDDSGGLSSETGGPASP